MPSKMLMIGVAVIGASYHHPRLPKEGRHQLVDAGPGRERVRWAGQVHGCHRSRGARRTTLCRQEGEQRSAVPSKKSDRSAARPRTQWSLLRAPDPGPEPPGAARACAESRAEAARTKRGGHGGRGGGEASEGGERKGSEERGRGAGQPAPRKPRASTAAPPAARRPGLGFRSGKPAVPGGLTVPSSGEKEDGGGR